MPISKQRNKHLQCVLIEAAKLGPRLSPDLALLYDRENQRGHANRATLAVARKNGVYQDLSKTVSKTSFSGRSARLGEVQRIVVFLRRDVEHVLFSGREE
jgi:hypothetical protein